MKYENINAIHTKENVAIPDHFIIRQDISVDARMIACYLESQPKNYPINISQISERMGITDRKVTKSFDELLRIGLLENISTGLRYTGLWEPDLRL